MARVERIFVLVAAAYGPNATFLIKLNLGAIHWDEEVKMGEAVVGEM